MKKFKIDLNEIHNKLCVKCKNFDERSRHIVNDLCGTAISIDDGLGTRCVGSWGYEKIYRLVQYFGIFSVGMHRKWPNLNYIEVCSGPGRCVIRSEGQEIDGTVLAILKHSSFKYINQAIFIDCNPDTVKILNDRIKNIGLSCKAKAICVNFNDRSRMHECLSDIDKNSLNLVLVDPTECNISFSTIEIIESVLQNVDFIINVASGTDVKRNIQNAVLDQSFFRVRKKYEQFIGDTDFFDDPAVIKSASEGDIDKLLTLFIERYKEKWKELGYCFMGEKLVRQYYRLLFFSKHRLGLDFWKKANKYEPDGQKTLFD